MRGILALVAASGALLIAADAALACSCVAIPAREKLEQADGAVVARLLSVKRLDDGDETVSSADRTNYVYRVGRVYKGRPRLARGRRLTVRSAYESASCGLSNRVGVLTGLFLHRRGGRWHAGACDEVSPRDMRVACGP
ncbi:MAG: Tissue inhibitor of metalloproteinase [Thermoleophilaceae bacterium]|jgi:hypothetical protein|nr:Tissue inhibitor of metalloproteinase [Thermoleophilaceae bacterium]